MLHVLAHILGIDTQQSYWYDFWSGVATQASLIAAACSVYRKHNCRKRWCWRIGHYQLTDPATRIAYILCWRHHPEGAARKHLSAALIQRIHERHNDEHPRPMG